MPAARTHVTASSPLGLPGSTGEASRASTGPHPASDGESPDQADSACQETAAPNHAACPRCGRAGPFYARGMHRKCYEAWRRQRVAAGDWWRIRTTAGRRSAERELPLEALAAIEAAEAFRAEHGWYGCYDDLLGWVRGREARQTLAKGLRILGDMGLGRLEFRPVYGRFVPRKGHVVP